MSIVDYLNICRIEHVKRLLMDERAKASSIYSQVGYSDVDTYYTQFKKITGLNPTQYKSLYQIKEI